MLSGQEILQLKLMSYKREFLSNGYTSSLKN